MTNTQYIKWTHEGQQKIAAFELGEKCVVTDVSSEPVLRREAIPMVAAPPVPKEGKTGGCGGCNNGEKGLNRLLLGGAKLLKAELGMDACDEETIIDRQNFCESCEHYDFGVCNKCGCFCAAKVKLKSETCPVGRW